MAASEANATLNSALLWRACEGQRTAQTWPLVDDLDELATLEQLLDSAKPPVPAGCPPHPLLYTPFRYPERTVGGSRFVRQGAAGAMYAAQHKHTCMHESGHWARQFIAASSGLADQGRVLRRTLFSLSVTGPAIDLQQAPYAEHADQWMSGHDYGATQAIGSQARAAGIALIRYASVRDPEHRAAVAVLLPGAITCPRPLAMEDWELMIAPAQLVWRNIRTPQDQYVIAATTPSIAAR
ncbi:RES family NAD+ phosphorylase [Chitinibacteraceae bacterium HSL-7]